MGVFRAIKKGVQSGFRVNRWVGTERIKGDAQIVKSLAKNAFKSSEELEAVKNMNFEQCLAHFKMNEEDLQVRMQQAKKIVGLCLISSAIAFAYMFYQFHARELIAGFACFMVGALTLTYAFREHFNLFQMRQRRLGCTIREWFMNTISRGK